jgi:hypothetical protein
MPHLRPGSDALGIELTCPGKHFTRLDHYRMGPSGVTMERSQSPCAMTREMVLRLDEKAAALASVVGWN